MADNNNEHTDNNGNLPNKTEVPRKTKKMLNKGGLTVLIVIIAIGVISGIYGLLANPNSGSVSNVIDNPASSIRGTRQAEKNIHRLFDFKNSNYIAALHIEGVIDSENKTYNQSWLLTTIDSLTRDNENKAILLYIDSPGGAVYQADEVYMALQDYKKTGKAVYAYLGPLAASGGYYIACAADTICANRNTLTGSIGVIAGQSLDLTGLMEKAGIKSTTITAGKNKNMLNYNSPLTPEQKSIMQSVADECYDQFVDIVANSRNMKNSVVKKLADGRIYTARQALNNGLIDHIGTWDSTITRLDDDKFGGKDLAVINYSYEEKESLLDIITHAVTLLNGAKATSAVGIPQALMKVLAPAVTYPAYYYAQQ